MGVTVHHGDCLDVIPRLVAEGVVCDAVVTDPPYHLVSVKRWSDPATPIAANPDFKRNGMHRFAKGFMGQRWDGGDIAFRPETWATVATALRPGAFLVAFGGTRTYHRLACAIEDAGFVIQDTIAWLYGSGFPKRRDMLKPAMELICLAYKPGGKRTMQLDECRIGTEDMSGQWDREWSDNTGPMGERYPQSGRVSGKTVPPGRWPTNVCHDGSEEVTEAFAAFGESKSGSHKSYVQKVKGWANACDVNTFSNEGDSGSVARFFYCAKADKQDRWGSRHPTVKPVELMKWLVALVTPPGGLVLDPFAGSGTTGIAALATGRNAILIEREAQYVADIRERLAFYEGDGKHSMQAKNRNRVPHVREGDLFAPASIPTGELGSGWDAVFDPALDCALSYEAAIRAIGDGVKAGAPLPTTGYFGPTQSRG